APLPLDLGVVVVVDEDERRVQQWLVERRIAQFVRVLEIGEEAIDGSWISQQGPERVAFLERRSEWIARREREHQQNGGQPAHVHTRLFGDPEKAPVREPTPQRPSVSNHWEKRAFRSLHEGSLPTWRSVHSSSRHCESAPWVMTHKRRPCTTDGTSTRLCWTVST